MADFNLGTVTAYGYAKSKGYTGTEEEFAALMASYADVAEEAADSAEQAAASATTATTKAGEAANSATAAATAKTAAQTAQSNAETAATTATTKAGEATTAATTATTKASEATTAATTATGKATEAAGSATTATTKAGEASTSATNAAASATRAQEILDSIPEDYTEMATDVSNLKDGLDEISERKSTDNIFDPSYLVSSAGWTKDGEDYYGTAKQASDAFATSPYYPVNCDPSKRYVLSFKAMTPNTGGYSGTGLAIAFVYSDGASNQVGLPNNTNEYTSFILVSSDSTAQHGGIAGIKFGYSSGGVNVWHMKEITLNEGTTPIDYYGELTAVDKDAREGLAVLRKDFDEKTSNIRMPMINFQFDDGVAKDADIVAIFDTYNFKCGFAVPTNISDFSPYVVYQGKGYEIISHSTDGTGMNDASVDSAVIEAKLKASKETLENAGLTIRGFVTPNSIMNLKFRPLLRKYYDWADTISFGTYSGTINSGLQPYMMPVDGIYNGWRVSLQTTTLANAKLAVDKCIENYGCLTFYGHAGALDTDNNLTTTNLTSLLDYIADKIDAGECACSIPSTAMLNYFNVRNDDVSDGWISVSPTDAQLDSRLSVVGWDMRYNPKTKFLAFSARLTATEAISGSFAVCDLPVHLLTNAFGNLVLNESGKNMMFYNNKLYSYTSTWASGTSYRLTGFGIFDYVL